jgi:hypothetical protein
MTQLVRRSLVRRRYSCFLGLGNDLSGATTPTRFIVSLTVLVPLL